MTARGRLKVKQESWHWKWYNEWRRNKGYEKTARSQVDLCHYMRVLLIFGPWRWFWEGYLLWDLPPFFYTLFLALVGAAVYAFVTWPAGSLIALGLVAGALVLAAALLAVGYSIRRWYIKDTEAADAFIDRVLERIGKFSYYAFFPIWWPLYWLAIWIKRGGIRFGRGFVRVGDAFFTKRLFNVTIRDELITFTTAGVVIPTILLGVIVAQFYRYPLIASIVFGGIIGAILLVVMITMLVQRIRRWAKEDAAKSLTKKLSEPPPAPKEPSVFWAWLVAKKQRVCPLIETEGGGSQGEFGKSPWRIPDPK